MVSVQARLVSSIRPDYRPDARAAGLEADVALEIIVDATRARIEIVRRAGHDFEGAALRTIRAARLPRAIRGPPGPASMPWAVSFRLE